ncbi:MAG: AAA family ATPase, partial [Chloroflexi bacterium]|nr:AAA family ATPase [Chloroflexota bacterium]
MTMHTYLPQDRLRALVRGESLPDRTTGAALFADISGFTPLTEALRDAIGARQGAEELTKHLDTVYTALIAEIESYGGSVIGFSGDAVTCWFDGAKDASQRAAACAFALQWVMDLFKAIALPNGATTALALKVAVASGPARRFVVGDPAIQTLDVLAGATVARTSTGEHLAQRGEILLDEATVNVLGQKLTIKEWRTDHDSNQRFAVADQYSETVAPVEQSTISELSSAQLKDWLHKAQLDREQAFTTEFRPCAALFVRFTGIDYDSDSAEAELDAFVRLMQAIVNRYAGTVIQLTIGDKGSYAYLNFGALSTHEDDPRRAVKTALEIRNKTALQVQIGLTQGTMRVGAYGGQTRRTYGALSDEVNLAARLMSTAMPGEILLGGQIQKTTANDFVSEPRSPLAMKGKAEPLPVFAVTGERKQRAIRLQEPNYALPMVGRIHELQVINNKLELAASGQAQVIGIVAEAGMGKSRLAAEVIRSARKKGFAGYGGSCQSDAIHTPYHTWKTVWSAFFGVDPELPLRKQIRLMEGEIEDRAPERVEALPLLGAMLNLEIPENDFTQTLEPKDRKGVLHALLEDCLKAAAQDEPLLIIIEDLHWIDALSHDLLDELARALTGSRICFVLAYRPPQLARLVTPRLEALANFTRIELSELNPAECEQAIRAKLAQLYPSRSGAVPPLLVEKLMARAQGNPFYLEELLNFLRDRGLDPRDPNDLNKIELPDSLHTLILSRVDQLSEREKTTLRVASIIGRLFRAEWLTGYYPTLGALSQVQDDLEQLHQLDITSLDTPEPELAYLFKHIVTHEVTYESLPFAT